MTKDPSQYPHLMVLGNNVMKLSTSRGISFDQAFDVVYGAMTMAELLDCKAEMDRWIGNGWTRDDFCELFVESHPEYYQR